MTGNNQSPRSLTSIITAALLLCTLFSYAGDIDKAFKYLNTGDYPNAKKFLIEALADEPDNAGVNYGLAKFFSMKDNPAYNLDSAIVYISAAAKKIPFKEDDKLTKKFLALGVRDYTIQTLQKTINFDAYAAAEQKNTFESYQHFIDHYTDKSFLEQAINFRNQKAYMKALMSKSVQQMEDFMNKYPDASDIKEAKETFEKWRYEQATADGSYQSYKKYIELYPTGKYVPEARDNYYEKLLKFYANKNTIEGYVEFVKLYKNHPAHGDIQDTIYKMATKENTVEAFKNFIANYQDNRNIIDAWDQLYLLYTAEGTQNDYLTYIQAFPDAPNKDKATRDIEISARDLKPFQSNDKWGYAILPMTDSIVMPIVPQYEEAYEFSNGLAAVRSKPCASDGRCSYSYINKANFKVFTDEFNYAGNFDHGYAIVGVGNCEDEDSCLYGVINKRGKFVIPPVHQEINDASEDYYLVAQNDKYGYLDRKGDVVVSLKYTDGLPYSQGMAAVCIDGNWYFIDKTGKQAFISSFRNVQSFSDSLAAVTQDGELWGYIDMAGTFVIQPAFESAEDFTGGFAIISKKEKDPKNKSMTISQRYKIDKTGKILEKLTAPKDLAKKATKKKGGRR
ncbi:MAG TPA: WG repeat-containing protein [Chitinophagales bacterium]|nr:WG repeat-containing protein [Chitinophagales bacterium]